MATSGGALHTPPSGPQPSNPQSAPNLVQFDPKLVVPSQTIYFQRNDQLLFQILTNGTGIIVKIDYRWLTPQGEIKEGELNTPPITGLLTVAIPLYEGWLLSFNAHLTTPPNGSVWTFMQCSVGRQAPTPGTSPVSGLIWQGYIPAFVTNGWPGTPSKEITDGAGTLRSVTGTTPAAGAEINEVIPLQRRWTLLSFRTQLTTSATVANRQPTFLIDDGGNPLFQSSAFLSEPASTVTPIVMLPTAQTAAQLFGALFLDVPLPLQLKASYRIRTITNGLQVGDQYAAPQYLIAEWGTWDN